MLLSIDVIRALVKQHHEALAKKTAEQFADSPCKGMETLARQTLTRMHEEKIIDEFEIIAKYYLARVNPKLEGK